MNLAEAIRDCKCDVLKTKLEKFCGDIRNNLIMTFACPVCGTDLRSSFVPHVKNQWRGTCQVCHLGIQMIHRIEHEGHINLDLSICAYQINLPVSLVNRQLMQMMHNKWTHMRLPRRVLTKEEDQKWMGEIQSMRKRSVTVH